MVSHEIRIYADTPIAGMTGEKQHVTIDLDYEFEGYAIRVEQVFAWRDSITGKEMIPLDLAILIDEEVQRISAFLQVQLQEKRAENIRMSFTAPAPPASYAAM